MRSFQDCKDRFWNVELNIAQAKKIKAQLGIDLVSLDGDLLKSLSDVMTLVDVIFLLCADQAEKMGVTDEEFGRSLDGGAILDAEKAFFGELELFSRGRGGKALGKMQAKVMEIREKAMDLAAEKSEALMERAWDEMEAKMEALEIPGTPSTS